jgi:cell division protein FtsB
MKEFSAKRTWYSVTSSWWFLLVMTCIMLVLAISVIKLASGYRYVKQHTQKRQDELESLKHKEQELAHNVQKLNTNEGLEEVLREKYRAVKEGEELIIILDEQ